MATITFFVRRTRIAGAVPEYLFLTCKTLGYAAEESIVAPTLPGNDKTTLVGTGSPNFILNLGTEKLMLTVDGDFLPVLATQYPDLPAGSEYIFEAGNIDGSVALTSPTYDQSAEAIRETLLRFWADQSSSTWNNYVLGWPKWGSTVTNPDTTIAGTAYRLWEGNMRGPSGSEEAGEPGQFPSNFRWQVGDS